MPAARPAPVPAAPPAPPPGGPTRGPSAVWYWVAAGIALIGLAAAVVLGAAGIRDYGSASTASPA